MYQQWSSGCGQAQRGLAASLGQRQRKPVGETNGGRNKEREKDEEGTCGQGWNSQICSALRAGNIGRATQQRWEADKAD